MVYPVPSAAFDIDKGALADRELAEPELARDLADQAHCDPLTGLGNRRQFDASLESAWALATACSHPVSLILLDLDFFRQYNDINGRLNGDECLRAVAGALRTIARRSTDVVARLADEEFVMLLPRTHAGGAALLAQRTARAIADLRIVHRGSTAADHVSASIGACTVHDVEDADPRALLEAADRMLYRAKRSGRARIETIVL